MLVWDEQIGAKLLNIFIKEITEEEKKGLLLIGNDGGHLYSIWSKVPKKFKYEKLFLKEYGLKQVAYISKDYVEFKIS